MLLMFEVFKGVPYLSLMMPRDASLLDNCATDRCSFSGLGMFGISNLSQELKSDL